MAASKATGKTTTGGKGGKKKEKLHGIMAAASALTSLGDEDESGNESNNETTEQTIAETSNDKGASEAPEKGTPESKRYIPDHKKPDAALTFPEKLMSMMRYADKQPKGFCVAWMPDGRSFIIHDPDAFTRQLIPKYFKATKFSSFTRKLYRWGFRQVNRGIGPDDPVIFGNEAFQRDNAELMATMRSTTAARSKKKDGLEPMPFHGMDPEQNRMLLDRLYHEKTMQGQFMGPALQYPIRPGMMPMYMPYPMPPGGPGMGFMSPQQQHPSMMPQGLQQTSTPLADQKAEPKLAPGSASAKQNSPSEIVNAAISALRYAA